MKKSEVRELLLELYEEASAERRGVGSQKVQLISSSLFGLGILLTFATLIYYLSKEGFLADFRIVLFIGLMALFTFSLFVGIIAYSLFLHRVQRVHAITAVLLEKLLRELISGKKDEDQIKNELLGLFPHLRLIKRLKLKGKRWAQRSLLWENEKDLMK